MSVSQEVGSRLYAGKEEAFGSLHSLQLQQQSSSISCLAQGASDLSVFLMARPRCAITAGGTTAAAATWMTAFSSQHA